MRWLLALAAAIAVAALGLATFDAFTISGLRGAAGRQAATIRQDRATLAAARARLSGGHRDLITCADLSALTTEGYLAVWYVDTGGGLASTAATLPAHCVNQ